MIIFKENNETEPYQIFRDKYQKAINKNQENIEAINIASYNSNLQMVSSRFVNLKYIINDQWIFFSNYESPKAKDFLDHSQVSVCIFWSSINLQIRISAEIFKSDSKFSDNHYAKRDQKKNAIALSSCQSKIIDSYEKVLDNYNLALNDHNALKNRPRSWGGYTFVPVYFEFWEGNDQRANKREYYRKSGNHWDKGFLQP